MPSPKSPEDTKGRLDEEPWNRMFERALERCREERWELGLEDLVYVFNGVRRSDLPGLFYSYMGYALAYTQGHVERGLKLCNKAIGMEFYQPENYLNLARTHLLAKDRGAAWQAVVSGLAIDAGHPALLELKEALGPRRPAVIPFFSRRHFLNRLLGRLRADITKTSTAARPQGIPGLDAPSKPRPPEDAKGMPSLESSRA